MEEEKRLEKERKATQKAREQAEKDAQKRIPPSEMFRNETDKYSQFDDKVIKLIVIIITRKSSCVNARGIPPAV